MAFLYDVGLDKRHFQFWTLSLARSVTASRHLRSLGFSFAEAASFLRPLGL